MRYLRIGVVVVGISVMLAAPEAHAELVGPLQKLVRGAVNAATGWIELPVQVVWTTEVDGSLAGLSVGVVRGVNRGVRRTVVGLYETVSFLLRNYPLQGDRDPYGPLIEPAFIVLRPADKS
jgi:putative exosortase-associated protein (TIGR04073 family)